MNKKTTSPTVSLPVAAFVAASCAFVGLATGVLAQKPMQLVIYGNSVPTDARKVNGRLYIPVADVAKAMQWRLTVSSSKIMLQPPPALQAASTNPASGSTASATTASSVIKTTGGVGEELYTGKYRFRVNSVHETTSYERRYSNGLMDAGVIAAEGDGKLIVLDCVLTNSTIEKEEFCLSRDRWAENTVLLEKGGESLTPYAYDVAADEINPPGAYALSGATVRFALAFRVPKTFQMKALAYTIVRYSERGMSKGTTVHVNLTP